MLFAETVSLVMEENVVALSICRISIDQASPALLVLMLGSGSVGGLFGSHITDSSHLGWATVTNTAPEGGGRSPV